MPVLQDFLAFVASEYVHNVVCSELLMGLRDACRNLLGYFCAVKPFPWGKAVIAAAAVHLLIGFSKVFQQSFAAASMVLAEVHHVLQLSIGNPLLLLIVSLPDEVLNFLRVSIAEEENAIAL